MTFILRSQINKDRVDAGLSPIDDTDWARIQCEAGPVNCYDDTGPGPLQELRRWAVERAAELAMAQVEMSDGAGKSMGLVGVAAVIENYVLNGMAKTTDAPPKDGLPRSGIPHLG